MAPNSLPGLHTREQGDKSHCEVSVRAGLRKRTWGLGVMEVVLAEGVTTSVENKQRL